MSKLAALFLIVVLALGSFIPTNNVSSQGLNGTTNALEPFCGSPTTVGLLTEKNVDSGTVTVTNGETTLFVTFTTKPNYKLTATHLAVANSLSGIPVTSKGNPSPGQFPYQSKHNKVSTYTYEIPLNGLNGMVYVAAHADVLKTGATKTEGAWGEGTPFVPGKRSWGMYFMYTVQPCNEPPVAVDDNYSTDEDTPLNVVLPGILANDSDPDGDSITAELVTTITNGTLTLNPGGSFTYTPDTNYNGSDGFTYKARDSFGNLSNAATVAITINAVNDLPVALDDAFEVAEDAIATTFDVLANDTDADGESFTIGSVTQPANGAVVNNGTDLSYEPTPGYCNDGSPTDDFTYTLNPGGDSATVAITVVCVDDEPVAVNDAATVDEDSGANPIDVLGNDVDPDGGLKSVFSVVQPANGSVVITGGGTGLTYQPNANYCNNGSPTDTFTYRLNSAVGPTATVVVTVTCVDDAPVAVNDAATVAEDSGATSIDVLANDTDLDGGPISVLSVTQPANGSVVITGGGMGLTYQPNANSCNDGSPTDDFTYTLTPGSSTATVAVTVTCVNDMPSFNLPASPNQTIIQDAGAQTVSGFATNISAGPANESGQTVTFNVSNNNNALFASQPDIDESTGNLTYTPAGGATGSATVSVYLTDDGGTANGGVDTSAIQVFTITVNLPNAAPVAAGQAVSTNEDTLKTITLSATDADGESLTFFIVDNPANGSLGNIGAVSCAANTCTADVDYTPSADFNGSDSFTFKANDGQVDSNTATVDITVDAVNDAPSFIKGADQTVLEDSGAQTVNGWATAISSGPSNESGQTVSFNVTGNTNATLFSAGPAVNSNGDLAYTPAPDAFGSATITLEAQDDGGTANGGGDTSASQTFVINVTSVNDAPSFTKGADQSVDEDAGAQTVNDWATAFSAGSNESGQTVSFLVSNDNNSLFSTQPAISGTGLLTYTPAANQNGSATVSVQIQDNGGTANGGVDTSAVQTFTITVNAVNDAPVAQTKTASVHTNMKIVGVNPGLLTGVTDADTGINGCSPTFTVASVTANTGGTVSNVNLGTGTFDFDPNPGFTGMAVVNYTVQDNGCPGTATSAPAAINITVSGPVIWFVNAAVVGPGTGTLADPFKTLASADAVDAANHRIFLYQGTYANGIALNTGEWLIGQGATNPAPNNTFDALFGITPPSGSIARPVIGAGTAFIQSTVTLASNVIVKGITLNTSGTTQGLLGSGGITGVDVSQSSIMTATGTALSLNNVGGTLVFTSLTSNGAATGVDLTNVSATVTISSGTIQNTTTAGVSINGGSGNFSENFSTLSNSSGRTILVQNRTGGTISFGGTINGGGTGILLNNNTGATINFTSGVAMTLSTGINAAFTATGGGTVNVTGNNAITTTTGTALRVENTTIGTSGLIFRSISANGGANGIVLNNTGSSAGLTVTGNGGTCTEANTSGCTGGVIQNMTGADDSGVTPIGAGIALNNTVGVSLTRMYIHDMSNYGIRGTSVNGFMLDTSVVNGVNGTNVSSPFSDGSVSFDNLSGTSAITNSAVAGGYQRNIRVDNTTGTLTLTINNNSIHNTSNAAGDDGLFVEFGGGTATLNVTNNIFAAHGGDHFNLSLLGSPTVSLTFTGNAWSGGHPIGLGQGLFILAASFNSPGTLSYNISNNGTAVAPLVGNRQGGAMHVNKGSGTGSFSGTISNNFIGDAAVNGSGSSEASGIDVEAHGTGGSHTTLISNNTVRQFHNDGILILAGEGSATLNATVTGNTVTNPDASVASFHGVEFNIGTLPTDNMLACLHMANNSLTTAGNEGNGGVDLRMRQRQLTTVRLPGYAGANNDNAAVQSFLTGTNANALTTILASNTVAGGGGGFVGGAACPQP